MPRRRRELAALRDLRGDGAVRAVVPFTAADKLGPGVRASGEQRLDGADAVGRRRRRRLARRSTTPARRAPDGRGRPVPDALRPRRRRARSRGSRPIRASSRSTPRPSRSCTTRCRASCWPATRPARTRCCPSGTGYFAFHESLGLGTATFGFTVDVTDSGFDAGVVGTTHPDFHEGGVLANPTRVTYADDFTDRRRRDRLRRPRHDQRRDRRRLQRAPARPARPPSRTPTATTTASASPRARGSAASKIFLCAAASA